MNKLSVTFHYKALASNIKLHCALRKRSLIRCLEDRIINNENRTKYHPLLINTLIKSFENVQINRVNAKILKSDVGLY